MTAPKRDRAAYLRAYRTRRRESAGADAGAPFDLAALDEPPADDPNVIDLPVRLDDAHFAKLAALMRAVEARHGSAVKAPAAMRVAFGLAHRTIAGAD